MRVITPTEAAQLIQDDWTVVPGGFGSCGHPDALTSALSRRYRSEGHPRNLTLLFASASGDRQGRGVDALAQPGLVRRAIGGFWGLVPALAEMALTGEIEAHNWPQGVVSQLYQAIAGGKPGVFSRIGLNTFVDPDHDGGKLNDRTTHSLIQKVSIGGEQILFYPSFDLSCALLRGTVSDQNGNISMEKEVSFSDALSQAMAAKNSGGIVIVQVERLVENYQIPPHQVRVPGVLVDYVVVSTPSEHPQTYGEPSAQDFIRAGKLLRISQDNVASLAERIIISRATQEIKELNAKIINLGIGIPALLGCSEYGNDVNMYPVLSIESGVIGGRPASGLSFGASYHPQATVEQSALFDFYDGGGLDLSCLGFAEVDEYGNINVSKFNNRLYGAGGFINISQSTKNILFCGTFTANGLEVELLSGGLRIVREGDTRKFVKRVSHLTFSGSHSQHLCQNIRLITERAVFSLRNGVVYLDEIAPGISIEADILPNIEGSFVISSDCKLMSHSFFSEM